MHCVYLLQMSRKALCSLKAEYGPRYAVFSPFSNAHSQFKLLAIPVESVQVKFIAKKQSILCKIIGFFSRCAVGKGLSF